MKAHPDEHHALEQIAALLRAAEPHLAAMFSIFTRLTAHEGPPPDEDRVGPVRLPGRRGRRGAGLAAAGPASAARSATLRAVLIPTLLLAMIVVIITVALSGSGGCTPPDRASVFAYQSAHVAACAQASVKKATGHP